ncbi:MAG: hypothetical protein K2G04_09670, partial [Oscillospiraceae bacterium]|nr:hypothetical protein [Oscillospiraceae bacterium]
MKRLKRVMSGVLAITMTAALAACDNSENPSSADGADATTTTEATTTTAATVAVNENELNDEQVDALSSAMSQLKDVELENKEIKWLAHYDLNPSTNGASKKVELELLERKYGGYVTWIPTTWENRYNDLSTNVLGGTGVDLYASDTGNLPKGI